MKKLFVLTSLLLLAGCACLDEQPEKNDGEYHTVQDLYHSSTTCRTGDCGREEPRYQETRRVRKIYRQPAESYTYIERPVYQPRRVPVYNQPVYMQPAPAPVAVPTPAPVPAAAPCYNTPAAAAPASGCQPTVSETREPVEVVYKKTTYRTTYQPQTTSSVSYEKVPYTAQSDVVVPAAQPVSAPQPVPAPQPAAEPQPVPAYVPASQPAYVPAPVVREVVVPAGEYVTETVEISPEEVK